MKELKLSCLRSSGTGRSEMLGEMCTDTQHCKQLPDARPAELLCSHTAQCQQLPAGPGALTELTTPFPGKPLTKVRWIWVLLQATLLQPLLCQTRTTASHSSSNSPSQHSEPFSLFPDPRIWLKCNCLFKQVVLASAWSHLMCFKWCRNSFTQSMILRCPHATLKWPGARKRWRGAERKSRAEGEGEKGQGKERDKGKGKAEGRKSGSLTTSTPSLPSSRSSSTLHKFSSI